jgi:hypothetical protein
MKVYCSQCRHFKPGKKIPFSYGPPEWDEDTQRCEAPENKKDTHKKPDVNRTVWPWIINRFNDCIWYDPIEEENGSSSSSSSSSSSGVV